MRETIGRKLLCPLLLLIWCLLLGENNTTLARQQARELIEWVEFNRMQGIDFFTFYFYRANAFMVPSRRFFTKPPYLFTKFIIIVFFCNIFGHYSICRFYIELIHQLTFLAFNFISANALMIRTISPYLLQIY